MAQTVLLSDNGHLIKPDGTDVDLVFDDLTIDDVTVDALTVTSIAADFALADGVDVAVNTTTGSKIGTGATQKLGFFGATPVVQPSTYTQTYATAARTVASATAAALTDSTTGTTTTTLAAGVGVYDMVIPSPANLSTLSTGGVDVVTGFIPGHKFKILSYEFITTVAGTGASASLVFNFEIGTTNLTGGALTLLLADTDTIGKRTAATAITAANTGTSTDTVSLEVAGSGTAFTAGAGFFVVKVQNMDTADAFAGLVTQHAAVVADNLSDRKVLNSLIDDAQSLGFVA